MSDANSTPPKPSKSFILLYYAEGWGGWKGLPLDTMVSDDPADFDSVEEGRKLAEKVSSTRPYRTRVVRRSDREVVAEYQRGGHRIT